MIKKEELGKLIQENRKKLKMTQQDLADRIHVSDKAVSNWETGKNYPDLLILQDLNNILNLNIDETLTNKRKKLKWMISILIILFIAVIISCSFFAYYYYKYKNRYLVYEIELNESFKMNDGMILINNQNIIFRLDSIESEKFKENSFIDVTILDSKQNEIYYKKNFEGININFNVLNSSYDNIIKNVNKLYLKIGYIDKNNNQKEEIIPIKLIEIFDNSTNINQENSNKENLLLNNGYTQLNTHYYEKEKMINELQVKLGYSFNDKIFYYEFSEDKLDYYLHLNENKNILYGKVIQNGLINTTIEIFEYSLISNELICNIGTCENVTILKDLVINEYNYLSI